jgi:hypothetical protein
MFFEKWEESAFFVIYPIFPPSSVILTMSHRGGTRKYSIEAISIAVLW